MPLTKQQVELLNEAEQIKAQSEEAKRAESDATETRQRLNAEAVGASVEPINYVAEPYVDQTWIPEGVMRGTEAPKEELLDALETEGREDELRDVLEAHGQEEALRARGANEHADRVAARREDA